MLFLFSSLRCFRLGLVLRNISFYFSLVRLASETWVGALLEKAFFVLRKLKEKPFSVTSRSSTSRFAPWTAFKSQFCGFAAQKYSTKLQLKICRLARRYGLLGFCLVRAETFLKEKSKIVRVRAQKLKSNNTSKTRSERFRFF